jgi:hypothetical protein
MEYDGSFLGGDPDFPNAPKRTDAWIRQDDGDVPAFALRIELRLVGGETIREMFTQEQVCSRLGLQGRDRECGLHRHVRAAFHEQDAVSALMYGI